jgi:hypothetical protein
VRTERQQTEYLLPLRSVGGPVLPVCPGACFRVSCC